MRAAVLRSPGTPPAVEDVELAPPGPNEISVRIEAAGVCHSDLHYMRGELVCPLPVVLGHEGAGVVDAVGPGSRFSVGDRVALMWRPRCGECRACVTGDPVLCEAGPRQAASGGLLDGTSRLSRGDERVHHLLGVSCFAERVVVSDRAVVRVPDGVPSRIAAVAGCAVVTGVGAVLNVIGECAGESIVVFGAGGVGLSAVMGARLAGAYPIVMVDLDPAKLELARRLGATAVVEASDGGAVEGVLDLVPGGASWAVEAIGRPETMRQAFEVLAPAGTMVAVGLAGVGESVSIPINPLVQRQRRVVGCLYGSANPLVDLPRIFRLYLAGRLPLDELIGAEYALDDIVDAFDDLRTAVGRGVIVP
ncbi:zinc-binding dehydrogenase [Agromyces sp. MMS24-JH15]|uniref:zinc-binding dehydrogenase n=1 Tax=Agromyces sp. MMS24-JH15 TaxID=3243765 RepID=UPI0037491F63